MPSDLDEGLWEAPLKHSFVDGRVAPSADGA